jgi:hypothetical protein
MRRRIAVTFLALLLGSAVAARAQAWRAGIDSRVELMSILFRLAGTQEYRQCRVPAYNQAIDKYFAPFRNHDAVQRAHSLAIGFDAPMKFAVSLGDIDSLSELIPFDRPGFRLYQTWNAAKARDFVAAARQFVSDTNAKAFLQSQQPLFAATDARLQAFIRDKADLDWFATFFGPPAPARLTIVPGMANGAPSYAARFIDASGVQEMYAIAGVSKVDPEGIPVFDSDWRTVMVHELAEVYASPAAGKYASQMQTPASQIYQAVAGAMQQQSYGNWRIMVNQSLARAATIEYVIAHDGQQAARTVVWKENAKSFFWMGGLVDLLETYRKDRQQYPTFESFMPRVVEFFNDAAPTIQDLIDRLQPKAISTSIPDGASDVDPATKGIVVRFSMPMNRVGPDRSARISGGRFDASATAVTIPVTLEPQREYAIPLRWSGGQAFLSADGVPLPAVVLRFRTGAAAAPQKQ